MSSTAATSPNKAGAAHRADRDETDAFGGVVVEFQADGVEYRWWVSRSKGKLFAFEGLLVVELQIAFEAAFGDHAEVEGVLDGAGVFVGVGAVGEAAVGGVGAELDEVGFEFPGFAVPEFELAQAWGVDDVAAGFEADEFGGGGGVLALGRPVGDLADLEVQAGLDGVQE